LLKKEEHVLQNLILLFLPPIDYDITQGRIQGMGAPGARPPKIGKKYDFLG
jgi:hypothetical protein